jgi:uncharacterized protein with FMN-binding domain
MTLSRRQITAATMAGLAVSAAMAGCSSRDTDVTTPPSASAPSVDASRSQDANSRYADGRYTATGFYGSLPSSITMTVTLDDDVITTVNVTPHATDPTSLDYQRRFAAVPAVVVGKDIDEVHVDRLAGASGTPDGFNAALEQIESQARK